MLAQEKLNVVSTESAWILHHFEMQKYLKLNYHNLETVCIPDVSTETNETVLNLIWIPATAMDQISCFDFYTIYLQQT